MASNEKKYQNILELIQSKFSSRNGKIKGIGPNQVAIHFGQFSRDKYKTDSKYMGRHTVLKMIADGIENKEIEVAQQGGGKSKPTILKVAKLTSLSKVRNVEINAQKNEIMDKISKLKLKRAFVFEDFLDFLRLRNQIKEFPFLVNSHNFDLIYEGHRFASARMDDLRKIEEIQEKFFGKKFERAQNASIRLEDLVLKKYWSTKPKLKDTMAGKIRTHHNTINDLIKNSKNLI